MGRFGVAVRLRKGSVARSRIARSTTFAVIATLAVGSSGGFTVPATAATLLPPTTPTNLTVVGSVQCGSGPRYVGNQSPTLTATSTDPNGLSQVGITFNLDSVPAGSPQQATNYGPSGTAIGWVPSALADGNYAFTAQAITDDTTPGATNVTSATSASVPFTVDTTPPAVPTISSTDFPPNRWGGPGGMVSLSSTSSDVAGFAYAIDGTVPIPLSTDCPPYGTAFSSSGGFVDASGGAAVLTIPASGANSLSPGPHLLTVTAFDQAHNVSGQNGYTLYVGQPAPPPGPPAGSWTPITPTRVLDTRQYQGGAALAPNSSLTISMYPLGGPNVASAVVLNLTAVAPTASGYITAYSYDSSRPGTSTLNFARGQTIANLAVVPIGPDALVTLFNGSKGTVQLLADLSGYFLAGTPSVPGAFQSLAPARLLDTRIGKGGSGPVAARGSVPLLVTGGAVPANASAVVLNVTVTQPVTSGNIAVYPEGTAEPVISNLNFVAGQTSANLAIVKVGTDGKVAFTNNSPGTVQLVADIAGYYLGGGTPSGHRVFVPVTPTRLMDTRHNVGVPGPISPFGTAHLQITGGVVPVGAVGVVLNVTVTEPQSDGNVVVYADLTTKPGVSNLNFTSGQTVPNLVMVWLGGNGKVALTNNQAGSVQIVADVSGYYLA